jgi:hypothetical protein
MKKIWAGFIGLALLGATPSMASTSTFDLGPITVNQTYSLFNPLGVTNTFDDFYKFSITPAFANPLEANVLTFTSLPSGIDGLTVSLFSGLTPPGGSPITADIGSTPTDFKFTGLLNGGYFLDVHGSAKPSQTGFYAGLFSVTAVPLPAGLPLMATALAALGFFAWRRRKTTA